MYINYCRRKLVINTCTLLFRWKQKWLQIHAIQNEIPCVIVRLCGKLYLWFIYSCIVAFLWVVFSFNMYNCTWSSLMIYFNYNSKSILNATGLDCTIEKLKGISIGIFLINSADCCSMKSDGSWWDDDCDTPQPFVCDITL